MHGVFLIHHMKRSGGHAVINWLVDNTPGAVFVNNDVPIQPILTGHRSIPDGTRSYDDWLHSRQQHPEFARTITGASAILVSLEDHELSMRPFDNASAHTIIILRHPQNLFASRIKKAGKTRLSAYALNPRLLKRAIRVWKEHARTALEHVDAPAPPQAIFYDAWLTGEGYRACLARDLGFTESCPPSGRPAHEGGGSSFGQGEVVAADLLRRADYLNDTERRVLDTIMSDPEMANLAEDIAERVARLSVLASPAVGAPV